MPIRKQVTLKTIAQQLGVTIQTVNKALKGKPGMSEATRQLIVETAEKLGYFTKEQIRSLRAERIISYPIERKDSCSYKPSNPLAIIVCCWRGCMIALPPSVTILKSAYYLP